MDSSNVYEGEFDLLFDDLTSIDGLSSDDASSMHCNSLISRSSSSLKKGKHAMKKRKIDVVSHSGELVVFEATYSRPRILRSDIRRSYANMYVNTMNSGDFSLLFGFMDTFCSPNFNHSIKRQFTLNSKLETFSFHRNGIASCAQFWCYNFVTIPDASIFLTDATIITCDEDNTSKVVAHYMFKATKLYDCSPFWKEVLDDQTPSTSKLSHGSERISIMNDILRDVEDKAKDLPLRSVPLPVVSKGEFIIFLDDQKRMIRMEMSSRAIEQ